MITRARRSMGALAITIAMLACGACSLVSGWSDLQGGRPSDDKPPTKDSGSSNEASPFDGATSSGGDVSCGAAKCPPPLGCCAGFDGNLACTTRESCDVNSGDRFLTCTSGATCPATAPLCCYDFAFEGSACLAGCAAGLQIMCDPSKSSACPAGQTCTGKTTGLSAFSACR
jgi:hypothetical protein